MLANLPRITAAFILGAFIVPAHAAEKPPQWAGIWAGTVGDAPVRVCLSERTYWETQIKGSGAYYYLKYLKPLHLEQETTNIWAETSGGALQASDPRWQIDRIKGDDLSGRWIAKGKSVSLRLNRISAEADCGSKIFNQPRFKPFVLTRQDAELDGQRYVKLTSSAGEHLDLSFESFQLTGAGAAIRKVNEALRAKIPVGDQQPDFFDCSTGALSVIGYDGDYSEGAEPVMLTRGWLSARTWSGGYCGGAHPFHGSGMLTFNLRNGEKVDLRSWLNERAFGEKSAYMDSSPLSEALREFLLARWPTEEEADTECKDAARESSYWDIGLERTGMSFTPEMPHVLQACANPVLVPYTELTPYLSRTGKVGVASVMADLL